MEQNRFDKIIKEKLQNLEAPYTPTHWEQMENTLNNTLPTTEASEATAFDALISSKLENLGATVRQPNWDRMSEALDSAGISDKAFDREVKTKINYINPVYQASHWELLATRLRKEKAIKECLFKNKVAELTLLLLLLLNFNQYFPNFPTIATPSVQEQIVPFKTVEPLSQPVEAVPINPPAKEQSVPTIKKATVPVQPIASTTLNTVPKKPANTSITDNQLYIVPTRLTALGIDIKGASTQPVRQETTFGIDGKTGLTITVPEMTRHLAYVGLKNSIFLEALPSLAPASLATATIVPLDCEKCKKYRIPARFRFGMISHIGLTGAERSSDQFLGIGSLTQKGAGYGSGFSLGFKYGRYEIETGLLYSAKTYHPNIVDTYGTLGAYKEKRFNAINLQVLQVPINLRHNYAVLGNGKWHLYAQTGMAMNIILRAQYDIPERPQPTSRWIPTDVAATSRLNRIDFNEGILGGDSLKDNTFFTFNIGAGADYYLSPRWSIFMQPDVHYHFSQTRIGPTKDRIHSISLSFGVRTSFY